MSLGVPGSNLSAAVVWCDVMSDESHLGTRPQIWSHASCLTSDQQPYFSPRAATLLF